MQFMQFKPFMQPMQFAGFKGGPERERGLREEEKGTQKRKEYPKKGKQEAITTKRAVYRPTRCVVKSRESPFWEVNGSENEGSM